MRQPNFSLSARHLLAALLAIGFCAPAMRAVDDAGKIAAQNEPGRPHTPLGHWQEGQINIDDKWVSVEESQRRAAADPRQMEYLERKAAAANELPAQLELAKWCSKNKLDDE